MAFQYPKILKIENANIFFSHISQIIQTIWVKEILLVEGGGGPGVKTKSSGYGLLSRKKGKTHIKKVFFFSGGTTKYLPPNGLVVHFF